jgi:type 1 glutamine amidotransferase/glucose/arabinose dehydrogenase
MTHAGRAGVAPRALRTIVAGVIAASALIASGSAPPVADAQTAPRVLVFHGTAGERHASIPAGVAALKDIGRRNGFGVDDTQDAGAFTAANLARYRAVVFLSANGDVLNADQEAAFQTFVKAGGGFLGVHDAARVEPDSEWFTGLIGTRPGPSEATVQKAVVEVGDRVHPATRDIPVEWTRSDEWLNCAPNPVGSVHTVARVRERSYAPGAGANGWNHPVSWCRDYDGGRSFYTAMGHTPQSFSESRFRTHLQGALRWTVGTARADCQATIYSNYRATRLTQPNQPGQLDQIGEPHGLAIAPDGRVFYNGRAGHNGGSSVVTDWNDPNIGRGYGTIHVWDPRTGTVTMAANLDVFGNKGGGDELTKAEEGLLGIELDPNFQLNGWLYAYWMPHSTIDRERRVGMRRISRFTVDPATNRLDLASEKVLLEWETQIHSCCHAGGGMSFDSKGNLYIATGDSNSSGGSQGYSGNNPRLTYQGISFQDARRTAGSTNDLNGKILRIHPEPDGTYTIPRGNLFSGREEGGGKTRREIYVMGVRNPARIWVDQETDWLLAGWVGPDAGNPNTTWGPAKYENLAAITKAGNQGWPYCMGNRQPYRDRNMPDPEEPLGWYDCNRPRNESPHNTGLVRLPPVRDNTMWYAPQGGGPVFEKHPNGVPIYDTEFQTLTQPYLSGGGAQAVMTGPIYRYDAASPSAVKWPAYWDGKWMIGDFYSSRSRVAVMLDPRTGADGVLDPPVHAEDIKSIVPATSGTIRSLMGWRFGPDGALYVLDYGTGFFFASPSSALWRVTYHGGPPTPLPQEVVK